jgi:hypothetical protein
VLTETIDFGALRSGYCPVNMFLSATNVRTGKIKISQNEKIGPEGGRYGAAGRECRGVANFRE